MAIQNTEGTFPLDDLNELTVAEGDPDPRGWDVVSSDDRKVGEVKDLLVDVRAMKVRYLDVELDNDLAGERDHHVLLPVGTARLDDDEDRVMVKIAASQALSMPKYQKDGAVKREHEDSIFTSLGMGASMAAGAGIDPDDYYERPEFDTRDFYGKRGIVIIGLPATDQRATTGDIELQRPMERDTGNARTDADDWKRRRADEDKHRTTGPG